MIYLHKFFPTDWQPEETFQVDKVPDEKNPNRACIICKQIGYRHIIRVVIEAVGGDLRGSKTEGECAHTYGDT
jgi:hypothetical protein